MNFLNSLEEWSLVLDAGCGNGKYLAADFNLIRVSYHHSPTTDVHAILIKIGSDLSRNLAKIASKKAFSVFRSNLLSLPLRDGSFDAVICAAVVHHFSTEERRLNAFKEIARVLKRDGRALISGWSKEQGDSFYQKMRSNRLDGGGYSSSYILEVFLLFRRRRIC